MEWQRSTEQYVEDVSSQLANHMTSRIEAVKTDLKQTAASVSSISASSSLESFLNRQATMLGFDAFVILDTEGNTVAGDFDSKNLKELSGIRSSLQGEAAVTYEEGQNLLFSAPVYENGNVEGVIVGVRGKENMQALIQ